MTNHYELNWAYEEHEELEDHVLALFFHLVEAPFASSVDDFGFGETDSGVGLELIFGNNTATSRLSLFFFVKGVAILGLEILDQGVHVLVGVMWLITRRK